MDHELKCKTKTVFFNKKIGENIQAIRISKNILALILKHDP